LGIASLWCCVNFLIMLYPSIWCCYLWYGSPLRGTGDKRQNDPLDLRFFSTGASKLRVLLHLHPILLLF